MMWNIHPQPIDTKIDISASGDTTLVASNAAGYNYIFNISVVVSAPTTIILKCGTREVAKYVLAANATMSISVSDYESGEPYFTCIPGEAFVINSSAAVGITGTLKYAVRTN